MTTKKTPGRFNMRIEGDFQARLQRLSQKKGLDSSSIVRLAVAEMDQREFPETPLHKKAKPTKP